MGAGLSNHCHLTVVFKPDFGRNREPDIKKNSRCLPCYYLHFNCDIAQAPSLIVKAPTKQVGRVSRQLWWP